MDKTLAFDDPYKNRHLPSEIRASSDIFFMIGDGSGQKVCRYMDVKCKNKFDNNMN